MKKLLCLLLSLILLSTSYVAYGQSAGGGGGSGGGQEKDNCPNGDISGSRYDGTCGTPTGMTITLNPGWNVVSTPTVLSNVSFSNGGDGISFMYLEGNQWKNTAITPSNVASVFKPLEGFLVKNNNSEDVKMTLSYDINIDIAGVMREKEVRAGWNFLGITKTSNPFEKIVSTTASIIVDFSRKFYNGASVSYMTENPSEYEIGKAYGVFADKSGVYGGLTAFLTNINCNEPNIAAACAVDSVDCPAQCQTSYQEVTGIKLQNTNLGSVTVTRGAYSVTVSEGTILVERAVTIPSFSITANNTGIDSLVFIANGNEYTATTTDGLTFTFENVQIAKSGKVQFKADIHDDATLDTSISLPSITKTVIQNAKFSDNNQEVGTENIAGSIIFSQVYVTVPKASMENTLYETVSFPLNDDMSETVHSGTYTAKFGDIYLNNIIISGSDSLPNNTYVYFSLFINDNKVAEFDPDIAESFQEIQVAAGESVNIRVDAEVDAYGDVGDLPTFRMTIGGRDVNGEDAGNASNLLVPMRVVDGTDVAIPSYSGNQVLFSTPNTVIAQFKVEPADMKKGYLDSISFSLDLDEVSLSPDDIKLTIDDDEVEVSPNQGFVYWPYMTIYKNQGAVVKVILKNGVGTARLSNLKINGHVIAREFWTATEDAVVSMVSQTNLGGGATKILLHVKKRDDVEVHNLIIKAGASMTASLAVVDDSSFVELINAGSSDVLVDEISYDVYNLISDESREVVIKKADFNDFFLINGTYARAYGNHNY